MDLTKKLEEVKQEETNDVTLPSSETPEVESSEEKVELNNSSIPTAEQVEEGETTDAEECCENVSAVENDHIDATGQEMTDEQKAVEKMLSQSQVNEIVGKTRTETRDSTLKAMFDHFGVDNEEALEALVGDGQRYPMLKEEYDGNKKTSEQRIAELEGKLSDVSTELALFRSDIDPDRYEDAKLILKGKGLDITADNIKQELLTHPEWEKKSIVKEEPTSSSSMVFEKDRPSEEEPTSRISRLGNDKPEATRETSEKDSAMELFDI